MEAAKSKAYLKSTDEALKNGPTEVRNCTDMLCCLIFTIFFCATVAVTVSALKFGNPKLLATPYDPDHRACGVD